MAPSNRPRTNEIARRVLQRPTEALPTARCVCTGKVSISAECNQNCFAVQIQAVSLSANFPGGVAGCCAPGPAGESFSSMADDSDFSDSISSQPQDSFSDSSVGDARHSFSRAGRGERDLGGHETSGAQVRSQRIIYNTESYHVSFTVLHAPLLLVFYTAPLARPLRIHVCSCLFMFVHVCS